MSRQFSGNRNGTQLLQPKLRKSAKYQQKKQKSEQFIPKKGGMRIGSNEESGKWRCKTCKHLNSLQANECQFCEDPRQKSFPQQICRDIKND